MLNDNQVAAEPSVTSLVSGIFSDAQDLLKQQVALIRHEVQADFQNAKEAGISLTGGMLLVLLGSIFLCLTAVHGIAYAAPDLPMWACHALVGAPLMLVGGILAYVSYRKLKFSNLLPDQSAQALKENVQWLTNRK